MRVAPGTAPTTLAGPPGSTPVPGGTGTAPPPPGSPPAVPGYALGRELGRGGVGVVYEATDRRLGPPAGVKRRPGRLGADDQVRRDRFSTEAAAVARLDHPNVVRVYEAGEAAGVPYMALE